MPRLGRLPVTLAVAVVTVVALAALGLNADAAAPAGLVEGTLYRDLDNDGRRDTGEPPVSGVMVSFDAGGPVIGALSDAAGRYRLRTAGRTGSVRVNTGWLRSACALDNRGVCGAGPAADSDFGVNNFWIETPTITTTAARTLDVGLVPDWGAVFVPGARPSVSVPPDPAARAFRVDAAARMSWVACNRDPNRKDCPVGATVALRLSLMNQGTAPLSGLRFRLERPADTRLTAVTLAPGLNPTDWSVRATGTEDASGSSLFALDATLPPGAVASLDVSLAITGGANSPRPARLMDPLDRRVGVRILGMDQGADADSPWCSGLVPTPCDLTDGSHSTLARHDIAESTAFNVVGGSGSTTFDLAAAVAADGPSAITPGGSGTVRITVRNEGRGDAAVANIDLGVTVPDGLIVDADSHPGWQIAGGLATARLPGPLLPGAAVTIPLRLRAPAGAPARTGACSPTPRLCLVAEVAAATSADDNGNPSGNGIGYLPPIPDQRTDRGGVQTDLDSTPDRDPWNDASNEDDRGAIALSVR